MPDQNSGEVETPIIVNPSAIPEQFTSAMRIAGLLIGALVTILGFLSTHDLQGLTAWIRSTDGAAAGAAAFTALLFLYSQWKIRQRKAQAVVMGRASPDSVAVVKGDPPAPPRARETKTRLGSLSSGEPS
jgi:hypothetical protein